MERRAFLGSGLAFGVAGLAGRGGIDLAELTGNVPTRTPPGGPLRLSSNENALGLAPAARRAIIDGLDEANRYPERHREELVEMLAVKHGVPTESIVLGNGSTEILQMSVQATATPGARLVLADPTFEAMGEYASPYAYRLERVPLEVEFRHNIDRMAELARGSLYPVVVYICNPNNPTGTLTPCAPIDDWIASAPDNVRFIVDEAYYEYAEDPSYWSSVKWVADRPNVVVARTFSKIYAMAGIRIGYGIAHPDTVADLRRYIAATNTNELGLVAALASLRDSGLIERSLHANRRAKQILHRCLEELDLEYLPSHANFVMHRISGDLDTYRNRMREHDVQVGRDFPPMLSYNRLSLGLPDEMERFAEILRGFRKKGWV